MIYYAIPADVFRFQGRPVPELDAEQHAAMTANLGQASVQIRNRARRGGVYDVGVDGTPSNPIVREAFRDATCALYAMKLAAANGVESAIDWTGAAAQWDSGTMLGVTISRGKGDTVANRAERESRDPIGQQALGYLVGAGIFRGGAVYRP